MSLVGSLVADGRRPFGAPAEDVFKSEVAVLIGAGIGVTVGPLAVAKLQADVGHSLSRRS